MQKILRNAKKSLSSHENQQPFPDEKPGFLSVKLRPFKRFTAFALIMAILCPSPGWCPPKFQDPENGHPQVVRRTLSSEPQPLDADLIREIVEGTSHHDAPQIHEGSLWASALPLLLFNLIRDCTVWKDTSQGTSPKIVFGLKESVDDRISPEDKHRASHPFFIHKREGHVEGWFLHHEQPLVELLVKLGSKQMGEDGKKEFKGLSPVAWVLQALIGQDGQTLPGKTHFCAPNTPPQTFLDTAIAKVSQWQSLFPQGDMREVTYDDTLKTLHPLWWAYYARLKPMFVDDANPLTVPLPFHHVTDLPDVRESLPRERKVFKQMNEATHLPLMPTLQTYMSQYEWAAPHTPDVHKFFVFDQANLLRVIAPLFPETSDVTSLKQRLSQSSVTLPESVDFNVISKDYLRFLCRLGLDINAQFPSETAGEERPEGHRPDGHRPFFHQWVEKLPPEKLERLLEVLLTLRTEMKSNPRLADLKMDANPRLTDSQGRFFMDVLADKVLMALKKRNEAGEEVNWRGEALTDLQKKGLTLLKRSANGDWGLLSDTASQELFKLYKASRAYVSNDRETVSTFFRDLISFQPAFSFLNQVDLYFKLPTEIRQLISQVHVPWTSNPLFWDAESYKDVYKGGLFRPWPDTDPQSGDSQDSPGHSRHKVSRINRTSVPAMAVKEHPHLPGVEYAFGALARQLFGRGAPHTSLIRRHGTSTPLLLSQIEATETLQSFLTHPQGRTLDPEQLGEQIILAILTHPEDGKPGNYVVRQNTDGKYHIIAIDNDHSFGPGITEKVTEGGSTFTVCVKTILYCMDIMHDGVHPHIIERLRQLNPEKFLETWVTTLQSVDAKYMDMFRDTHPNGIAPTVPATFGAAKQAYTAYVGVPFTIEIFRRLYSTLTRIQEALRRKVTYIDLLHVADPPLAGRYGRALSDRMGTLERFNKYDGPHYQTVSIPTGSGAHELSHMSMPSALGHMGSILGIQDVTGQRVSETLTKEKLLKPAEVLEELRRVMKQVDLDVISDDIKYLEDLKGDTFRQASILRTVPFADLPPKRQTTWLVVLPKYCKEWSTLFFNNWSELSPSFFRTYISFGGQVDSTHPFQALTAVELQKCPKIDGNAIEALARLCPTLSVLKLVECLGLTRVNESPVIGSAKPLSFSSLIELDVSFSQNLEKINLTAPRLIDFCTKGCSQLKEITFENEKLISYDHIKIPDIARGYEEIYRQFMRGKLIYKPDPKSNKGRIDFPIRFLANPLEGEFDLSRCGDTEKYLSIATGYRKGKKRANADKLEIWIAPRSLIERNLATSASHFKPIMGDWNAATAPVGLFWTWGGSDDMRWYDYETTNSLERLGDNDLYEKYLMATTTRHHYGTTRHDLGHDAQHVSRFIFELKQGH